MRSKTTYQRKLVDPRWQKKRLEILERDSFRCRLCMDDTKELHVHHTYYEKGKQPWEYPNETLMTLCHRCHEHETNNINNIQNELIFQLKKKGYAYYDFVDLVGFIGQAPNQRYLIGIERYFSGLMANNDYRQIDEIVEF